ncbi:GntR family transcriptional regulator [Corynebacterium pseudotuberculosis]|uniref:GntR family transcriptional regulator n=1 Tax=Corynebacterium pseudotuberculosis TaxID=1719 RepID=UPI002417408B|nr:GntR family transcriptional regulator [Corynebacterium pseudotuberculosis]WFP67157.1 GntR family transcriptional regulator [Corynebacterium pseudotuberculosis]
MNSHVSPAVGKSPTAAAIEDYIRDNNLSPGDLLPSEAALCERLSVSRSSVREAMRTLASLDVVEIRHGHGTFVGSMSLAPLINGMVLRLTLNEELALENLSYVVDMRIALDLANAEELANSYKGQSTEVLDRIVEAMREKYLREESFVEEDWQFHKVISEKLSNPLMREMSMALWEIHTKVVPVLGLGDPEDMEDTVEAHSKMIRALHSGDADSYCALICEHYGPLLRVIKKKREQRDLARNANSADTDKEADKERAS